MNSICYGNIFFFHNPKAGGTSVSRILETMFAPDQCCPLIETCESDHQRLRQDYTAFFGHRYYGGHYGYDIFRAVASGHAAVTNLRDPASRILSLYNFFRLEVTLPEDPAELEKYHAVAFAQRSDFHGFVASEDPRIEVYTRDHHVRQLTKSAWDYDCTGDFQHAVGLLDMMPWYYVCEHPDLSAHWARTVFGEHFISIPRVNVTSRNKGGCVAVDTIDPKTQRILRDKNVLDKALHAHATRRLLRVADAGARFNG